jgi:hypothetical protein
LPPHAPSPHTVTSKTVTSSQVDEQRTGASASGTTVAGPPTAPLTFPTTLQSEWNHIMHFQRYEYARSDARTPPKESKAGALISLPLPLNLSTEYSADWENESLGPLGNQLSNIGSDIYRRMKQNGGGVNGLKAAVEQYGKSFDPTTANDLLQAFALDKVQDFSTATDAFSRVSGLAINPYKAVLYRSPDFRSFQFSYKFIPSNKQEADSILAIVKEFKYGMHPSFDTAFADNIFKYPDIWRITIPKDDYLFKFLTCALKNVSYDPHGEGTKSYFRTESGDHIPLSVSLSLTFQEISVLTKEDIMKGY